MALVMRSFISASAVEGESARETGASANRKSHIKNHGGFTLIELLVVVAIIAVLVALLLPALGAARDRARTAVCASQLKQVANSLFLYAEDFSRFPNSHWDGFLNGRYVEFRWYALVSAGYLGGTTGIYVCPADSTIRMDIALGMYNMSYGVNETGPCPFRGVSGTTPVGWKAYRPSEVPNSNTTVLVCDSTERLLPVDVVRPPSPAPPNSDLYRMSVSGIWDVRYFPSQRHSGGSNVGFCDGHIAFMSWGQLMPDIPGGVPLDNTLRYRLWYLPGIPAD
jgi:prepilin-type N-terminal cleavage/methylation domain-containing protein/prepilin-type processing-associated H-X9-DG protein